MCPQPITKYFHGGPPNLRRILPPSKTGVTPTLAFYDGHAPTRHVKTNRIFITPDPEIAEIYAAMHPSGAGVVYLVTPLGTLEPDPDCSQTGTSLQCASAIVKRPVQFLTPPSEIRRILLEDIL